MKTIIKISCVVMMSLVVAGCYDKGTSIGKIQEDSQSIHTVELSSITGGSAYVFLTQTIDGAVWVYRMTEENEIMSKYVLFGPPQTSDLYLEQP